MNRKDFNNQLTRNYIQKLDNCAVISGSGNLVPIFFANIKEDGKWVKLKNFYKIRDLTDFLVNYHYQIVYWCLPKILVGEIKTSLNVKRQELKTTEKLNGLDDTKTNNIDASKDVPIKNNSTSIKKYIGIVKITHENMMGVSESFLSRFSDDVEYLNKWFELYPGCEHTLLENTLELNSMFEIYEDMTPITKEEHKELKRVKKVYDEMMKED